MNATLKYEKRISLHFEHNINAFKNSAKAIITKNNTTDMQTKLSYCILSIKNIEKADIVKKDIEITKH